jgi:hypothetical protein
MKFTSKRKIRLTPDLSGQMLMLHVLKCVADGSPRRAADPEAMMMAQAHAQELGLINNRGLTAKGASYVADALALIVPNKGNRQ